MNNAKLIKILQTFSAREKRNCLAWIQSPMHNKRADVIQLYEYFWKYHKYPQKLTKELAWATIYPNKPYNDGKMRQIMFQLLTNVEHFLQYQQLQLQPIEGALLLLQDFRKRKLPKLVDLNINQTKRTLQEKVLPNWQGLRYQYQLETIIYDNAEHQQRTIPLNLQELSDALDIQYFADKLRRACLLYSRLVVFQMDYQPKMLEVVIDQVADSIYLEIPAIAIYYYCYLSLTTSEDNDAYFEKMMTILQQNKNSFPQQEIRELYLLAINFTIKKLNTGSQLYLQRAFDLYKTGIEEAYLLQDNIISPFTFNNMVSIGISMKAYRWVEVFINTYAEKIEEEARQSIVQECLAKLYYAQKDYTKAQLLLVQVDAKDILRMLSCKVLLAQIYYETDELDALDSLLNSLKTYLLRKDVVGYHKENYKNIVYYMQKLVRVNPFDKEEKQQLYKTIAQVTPLTSKKWLLEQLS